MNNQNYADNTPNAGKLVLALRNTGYDNYAAIADIIDNSLDAEAQNVWVDITPGENDLEISIADNGFGMNRAILDQAMRLGSLTDRDAESDLGKFGMGLVTASISIGKRLEVITRQNGTYLTSVQDVDEIVKDNAFNKELRDSTDKEKVLFNRLTRNSDTGTVVSISKCDRVQNTNINQFSSSLIKKIAQTFRIFLASGKEVAIRGDIIKAYDPLMFDAGSEEYSDESFEIKVAGSNERIRVRIAMLPKMNTQESRIAGVNQANQGFYLLRNNREIASGETLGIFTKHNNLNRFRAEIFFSGDLDDLMGVTFTKRSLRPKQQILDKVAEIAYPQIKSILNKFKKENPAVAEGEIEHEKSAKVINERSKLLLKPKPIVEIRGPKTNLGVVHSKKDGGRLRKPYNSREVLSAKVNCKFELRHMESGGNFFEVDQVGKTTVITYNIDHPFYQTLFAENKDRPEVIAALDFLSYSLASAKLISTREDNSPIFENFFSIFSSNLRTLIS